MLQDIRELLNSCVKLRASGDLGAGVPRINGPQLITAPLNQGKVGSSGITGQAGQHSSAKTCSQPEQPS